MRIDLNSDCGESFGEHIVGDDEQVIPLVSSANLACGAHGGDHRVMQRAVQIAKDNDVRIGAHVSYPDMANFGREVMELPPARLRYTIVEQMRRLADVALKQKAAVAYVKPHGALYNQAHKQAECAETILDAMIEFDPQLAIMCMPNSVIGQLAGERGVRVIWEGFADRAYLADGSLAPRSLPGAVHTDAAVAATQALALARREPIQTLDGGQLWLDVQSLCIHSDTPGALELLHAVRAAFAEAGIEVGC